MRSHARVDASNRHTANIVSSSSRFVSKRTSSRVIVAIVNMACSEAEEGRSGADIFPVIVGVGNTKMTFVFAGVTVTVSSKGCLMMVMEVVAEIC